MKSDGKMRRIEVMPSLALRLDRFHQKPLSVQLGDNIRQAIHEGSIAAGARLPSWTDLAVQLGVSRNTVRAAYQQLADERLLSAGGAAGTRVCGAPPKPLPLSVPRRTPPKDGLVSSYSEIPRPFRVGLPAHDEFPFKTWSRTMVRAARMGVAAPVAYPDPCGLSELREELSAYLALARGMLASASQIFITTGHASSIAVIAHALNLAGKPCWVENPGYPATRTALSLAGAILVPVPVDAQGLDVAYGISTPQRAVAAFVTPAQQAPLGTQMSRQRQEELISWAKRRGAWIVEDDYLGELRLDGRTTPAMAANDTAGRVIYTGTFSKTLTPSLRLGFVVVPSALVEHFNEVTTYLAPAQSQSVQIAVADFMRTGSFLRHIRRMKQLYERRREAMVDALEVEGFEVMNPSAGLAVIVRLAAGTDDVEVVRLARAAGLEPAPLSMWYTDGLKAETGLLLGVPNTPESSVASSCTILRRILKNHP